MVLCCCHFGYHFSEFSPTGFYYSLSLIRVCESLQSFSVFGFSICCKPALVFSIMATSPNDETNPMSNRYIPRAARAVPHEEVVHTIEFRKITYPLSDRPAELWIVETNHRGHKSWRTLERFLDDFVITPLGAPSEYAMASCAHLETLALQWRAYYDVPDPFPQGGPPQAQELRRNFHHVLPQQIDPNTTFEGPHSSIPNHQPLLRACWGRSAFRRSQGNPAVSLLYSQPVLHTPPTLTSTTSTRPTTSDPTSRRQWLAQSPVPPTSSRSSPTHTD